MYKTIEISIINVKERSGPANYRKFWETEPWTPKVLPPFFLPPPPFNVRHLVYCGHSFYILGLSSKQFKAWLLVSE